MNFIDTLKSVDLVLSTNEVPLVVGESGIGKTALAKKLAEENNWSLVVIDGNLLKEGEIGGLPTIESYTITNSNGEKIEKKITVYAVHNKLREIDEEIAKGKSVLLFIDEINRCEHTVQQELMNLILNREINGYKLHDDVKILAAMNPSSKYGSDFDYQVVDMDAAQENRFVWLNMEPDYNQWLNWAMDSGIEQKVIEFISTFPEYLHRINEDDVRATPRSYERVSKSYKVYKEQKDSIPRNVFLNVIKGNVGKVIAEEFISFVESDCSPLISYEDVFSCETLSSSVIEKVKSESHTRLYLSAMNILKTLELNFENDDISENNINRFIEFLKSYPVDIRPLIEDVWYHTTIPFSFEGSQGSGLDPYFGLYPDVTASRPLARISIPDSTEGVIMSEHIPVRIGVMKVPYMSSVGSRVPPYSMDKTIADMYRDQNEERGKSTGRDRGIYPIDLVAMRALQKVAGYSHVVITHMDSPHEDIPIEVVIDYKDKVTGKSVPYRPYQTEWDKVVGEVITVDSWDGKQVENMRSVDELPLEARRFITFISKTIAPVAIITNGRPLGNMISFLR